MLRYGSQSLFWGTKVSIKNKQVKESTAEPSHSLARRSLGRHSSTMKTGRTLSAKRERLETSNERIAARQQLKRREHARILFVSVSFALAIALIVGVGVLLSKTGAPATDDSANQTIIYKPTIEVIDEDAGSNVTGRMSQYIGQAEADFRELGLIPVKAIIPAGAIREVDFYLDGHPGYIKTILDRDTAVSVEDASRMINYLEEQLGVTDYQYIDVRLSGRAYWK